MSKHIQTVQLNFGTLDNLKNFQMISVTAGFGGRTAPFIEKIISNLSSDEILEICKRAKK